MPKTSSTISLRTLRPALSSIQMYCSFREAILARWPDLKGELEPSEFDLEEDPGDALKYAPTTAGTKPKTSTKATNSYRQTAPTPQSTASAPAPPTQARPTTSPSMAPIRIMCLRPRHQFSCTTAVLEMFPITSWTHVYSPATTRTIPRRGRNIGINQNLKTGLRRAIFATGLNWPCGSRLIERIGAQMAHTNTF
jgi:hypothetical protein